MKLTYPIAIDQQGGRKILVWPVLQRVGNQCDSLFDPSSIEKAMSQPTAACKKCYRRPERWRLGRRAASQTKTNAETRSRREFIARFTRDFFASLVAVAAPR